MPPFAAATLVFLVNAAVLVIEILAARLLAPYVGDTLETYTAIIGTVLAGISLGAVVGGRLADRRDPRSLLGPILVAGGTFTLVIVPILAFVGPAFVGGGAVGSVLLAFLCFFAPATILSAVSPTIVKLQLDRLADTGTVVGRLSAIGTAGAIAGTFVTGFALVAAFPTRPVVLAVGVLLVLGGIGLHLALRAPTDQPIAMVAVVGLLGAGMTSVVPTPCEYQTAYYCARVIDGTDDPDAACRGRLLYLDLLMHSCVHLDDPLRLDFTYAQIMSDVIAAMAPEGAALDALHIGGGGFSMPRYLDAARPGSTSLVLELDQTLVEIARRELGLVTDEDLRVRVGDARTAIGEQPDAAYDLVIGDAFGDLAVPWHLTTREVVAEVRRTLAPGGIYAINLIDYPPYGFARAEVATLRTEFAHVAAIAPPDRFDRIDGGNFVLVASDRPLPLEGIGQRNAARGDDDEVLGGADLDAFVGDAVVLTDDYAPVDQLLGSRRR